MSKKQSSPKGKKAEMLDTDMIEVPVEKIVAPAQHTKVNLKEFSKTAPFSFSHLNYRILLLGLGINVLGYILMIGGAAKSLNEFNEGELFSNMRITISPMLIVAGFVIIAYAIMRKPKSSGTDTAI
jgi:hypothetical protein